MDQSQDCGQCGVCQVDGVGPDPGLSLTDHLKSNAVLFHHRELVLLLERENKGKYLDVLLVKGG